MAKGKTLGEYIQKWHVKKADWKGEHELEVLGVSNIDGITTTSHVKSEDLSGYLVIEPKTFAYNPYRINVGSVGLTPNNIYGVVSPAYIVFKVREGKLIPELLLEYLKSFDGLQQINKYARGTVRKALRFDDLCKIEVNFPEYNEQKHIFEKKIIVEKKSDELETEIQTQKQLLTQLKQSILQEAIQGKITADWRTHNPNTEPASELLNRIKAEKAQLIKDKKIKKEKPLPPITADEVPFELPEGWVWCRLNTLVSLLGDGLHGTPIYSEEGDYYFVNGNNLIDGKIIFKSSTKKVNEKEYEKYKKNLTQNTVLVSINGTLGNVAFYNGEKIMLGKSACYFNLFDDVNKQYLKLIIESNYYIQYALSKSSKTTINNLSLKNMRLLPIPFPPLEEQKTIVEKVETIMLKCQALEQEIKTSEANAQMLMQAVLKEAFEGKQEVAEV